MAKRARPRPVVRGALWLSAGVATGIAIGIAESRLRARRASLAAPPRRLPPATFPPPAPAATPPTRRRRARGIALGIVAVLALAGAGAAIAFVAAGDQRAAEPTTAEVAGTATVRRTSTQAQPPPTAATATATARRTSKSTSKSTKSAGFVPARVFAWPAVKGADRYQIRFYRGQQLLVRKQVRQPRFVIPPALDLRPGRYRWVVLPHVRGTYDHAVVDSKFVVGG